MKSFNSGIMDNPFFLPLDPNNAQIPASLSTITSEEDSDPLDETDFSASVLRYINQMLMEEDLEEKTFMLHDSLALQAAEKSFCEVIDEAYPSSSVQVESPDDSLYSNFIDFSSCSTTSTSNSVESHWSNVDFTEYKSSFLQTNFPSDFVFQASSTYCTQSSMNSTSSFTANNIGFLESSKAGFLDPNLLNKQSEFLLQFKKGMEEAGKFLPKGNPLVFDLENSTFRPSFRKSHQQVEIEAERDKWEHFSAESRGRKIHEREDETDLQDGRSNKYSAVCIDENELSELFDKALLGRTPASDYKKGQPSGPDMSKQQKEEKNKSGSGKSNVKKQDNNKKGVVDLRTLLIVCAQAVSSDDRATANEILKQIRQHSSRLGDGSQRLAHCFANALEARLAGTGTQIYTALSAKRTSSADMVKAYQMYISVCPFQKLAIIFTNHTILSLVKEVETLHIVDFGIRYGFHWPSLIFRLSQRPGGPPKLRMTGIELPQPGFRPAEKVQETGLRLARYCDRFNVPFEFNAIAQKWETIKIEDLKIKKNELVAVNCMVRFKNLLDETVVLNSPKDAVLNLIRQANPTIFIHSTINGSYNVPFFVTRFREALFHYFSLFDVLDTNVAREDPVRLMFEEEFFGREVMNIIACEGSKRVERPETFKQWQGRNMRAGFRQLPLDQELINILRGRLREVYHSDFMLDEDGNSLLQGWKGRILYASSCWVPA